MEFRRHQQPATSAAGPSLGRIVAAVGAVPAVIYGAAIAGVTGAGGGLVLWALACAVAVGFRRFRRQRHDQGATTEVELFEQLRRTPCVACGAPTLLDACLDCTEDSSHRHRRDDATPRDEPEDPAR